MSIITSATTGNFSDPATWVGGVVPGPLDNARANTGHNITIDVDVTVIDIQAISTGRFIMGEGVTLTGNVLGNSVSGNNTLDVTVTTNCKIIGDCRTQTVNDTYCVNMSGNGILNIEGIIGGGTAGGNRRGLIINSGIVNITGDVVTQVSSGSTSYNAIIINGFSIINIIGDIYNTTNAVSNAASTIISSGTNCEINVIGSIQSAYGAAISVSGIDAKISIIGNILESLSTLTPAIPSINLTGVNAEVNVIGNVYNSINGGSILCSGSNSLISIEGNVYANNFNTVANANPIRSGSTTVNRGVIIKGNIFYGENGHCPIVANLVKIIPSINSKTVYRQMDGTIYTHSTLTAVDFNVPFEEDVRKGVIYGDGTFEGNLIVPSPSNVRKGVPTDNTVGTADLTAQDFLDLLSTSPDPIAERLRNVATVQTTGDQITSLS